MPKVTSNGFEELIEKLGRISAGAERMAERAVDAASPALEASLSRTIREETSPDATGGLADSLRATKARTNERGAYSVVRPVGRDKDGKRYGERLAYFEYGTRRTAPRPVRARAANAAAEECLRRMRAVVEEVIDGSS